MINGDIIVGDTFYRRTDTNLGEGLGKEITILSSLMYENLSPLSRTYYKVNVLNGPIPGVNIEQEINEDTLRWAYNREKS